MIKKIILNNDNLDQLTLDFLNAIIKPLNNNFIIAGGFARQIAKISTSNKKLNYSDLINYIKNCGDIDFFNTSSNKINLNDLNIICNKTYENLKTFKNKYFKKEIINDDTPLNLFIINDISIRKSLFALNVNFRILDCLIKFQYIDFIKFDNIENLFNTFDIENSKYIITYDNNKLILIYTKNATISDNNKQISLCDIQTNELYAKRIYKYIKSKGCINGISESSLSIFNEFIYKPLTDAWNENLIIDYYNQYGPLINGKQQQDYVKSRKKNISFATMQYLIKSDLFDIRNINLLTLFINKWEVNRINEYSSYNISIIKKDWASEEINKILNKKCKL